MKIINNNYLDNKDNKQIIREQNNFAKQVIQVKLWKIQKI